MTKMRAVEISEPGGADVLRQVVKSIPQPNRNEVLINIIFNVYIPNEKIFSIGFKKGFYILFWINKSLE